jgi:hypothetical protein
LHTLTATLAASYVEEYLKRKRFAADCEAEIKKLKKELADYKLHIKRDNLTHLRAHTSEGGFGL